MTKEKYNLISKCQVSIQGEPWTISPMVQGKSYKWFGWWFEFAHPFYMIVIMHDINVSAPSSYKSYLHQSKFSLNESYNDSLWRLRTKPNTMTVLLTIEGNIDCLKHDASKTSPKKSTPSTIIIYVI